MTDTYRGRNSILSKFNKRERSRYAVGLRPFKLHCNISNNVASFYLPWIAFRRVNIEEEEEEEKIIVAFEERNICTEVTEGGK